MNFYSASEEADLASIEKVGETTVSFKGKTIMYKLFKDGGGGGGGEEAGGVL